MLRQTGPAAERLVASMANGTEVKGWRRGLSLLLAFVMLLSCVNLEAFAQEYDGDIFVEEPVIQEEEPTLFEEIMNLHLKKSEPK